MTASAPDAEAWRRLFASLTGESAVDAAMVRAFCETHRVTPAQVMSELYAYRQDDRRKKYEEPPL